MEPSHTAAPPREEVTFLQLLAVLLERWKLITACAVVAALLGVGLALLQKPRYTARIVLVPPASGSTLPFLGAAANLPLAGLSSRLGGGGNNQNLVAAILKSGSLQDSIVSRLRGPGALDDPQDPVRRVVKATTIRTSDTDRSVSIRVTDTDPRMAARVASLYGEVINSIATRVTVQTAQAKRKAVEQQLTFARADLERSEENLLRFERARGAPVIDEQARQTFAAAADLQRQIVGQELTVSRLRRVATPDNPQLRAAESELGALRGQLQRLRAGGGAGAGLLNANTLPDVKLEAGRLLREFTKDEQVYLSLTASLAEAQVSVNENLAVMTVLDAPRVPRRPSGPSKALYLIAGGMLGLVTGIALALLGAYLRRARRAPEGESFVVAWDRFKGDLTRWVPARRAAAGARSNGRGAGVGH